VGAATAAARPLLSRQGQHRQQLSFATKAVSAEPAVATTTGERPLSNRWLGHASIGTCFSSSCASGQQLHAMRALHAAYACRALHPHHMLHKHVLLTVVTSPQQHYMLSAVCAKREHKQQLPSSQCLYRYPQLHFMPVISLPPSVLLHRSQISGHCCHTVKHALVALQPFLHCNLPSAYAVHTVCYLSFSPNQTEDTSTAAHWVMCHLHTDVASVALMNLCAHVQGLLRLMKTLSNSRCCRRSCWMWGA
jgi:hypothetical protein